MAFEYTNQNNQKYFLHRQQITLRGSGKNQTIYYFSRKSGANAIEDLPEGYEVVENKKTGLPVLRKK